MTTARTTLDFRDVYATPLTPVDAMTVEMTAADLEEAAFTLAELRIKTGEAASVQKQLDDNEHQIRRWVEAMS